MLDCRGKLLREGDLVAIATGSTQVVGTLEVDPDDVRYVRLQIRISPTKKRYYDRMSRRILNLTELVREELDKPIVI